MEVENTKNSHGLGAKTLKFIIDGKHFESHEQYISGAKLRELGNIPLDAEIFLAIKDWEDEHIKDNTQVDLARPGIEHFFHKNKEAELVEIFIKDLPFKIKPGKHTVAEIKKLGNVSIAYDLDELINGKLTPLDDNAVVDIKGCEKFFAHPKEGKSS